MAKKKTVKKTKQTSSRKSKSVFELLKSPSNVFLAVLVFFGVVFVSYLGVQYVQSNNEKDQLLESQKKLDVIADKIVQQNEPNSRTSSQSCRYQSAKFEKGDLYCKVRTELEYTNINTDTANKIMYDSLNINKDSQIQNISTTSNDLKFSDPYDSLNSYFFQDITVDNDRCSISYAYPYPLKNSENMRVVLLCSRQSSAEHFSLEQ